MKNNANDIFLLAERMRQTENLEQKKEILLKNTNLLKTLQKSHIHLLWQKILGLIKKENTILAEIVFFSILTIKQEDNIFSHPADLAEEVFAKKLSSLLEALMELEQNYKTLGGVIGYHAKILELLLTKNNVNSSLKIQKATGTLLEESTQEVRLATIEGLKALPDFCEIYPVGGLGYRLGLKDRLGIPLPMALLPFQGKGLLSILIRDLIGREYLHFKLFGKQHVTPIALMTSSEQDNHSHIKALLEKNHWFGRSQESFCLFTQPSVPVVDEEGNWIMNDILSLKLEPGGHGAIWSTAEQKKVFKWFLDQGRTKSLIRQINNPLAGLDYGLLAFLGVGKIKKKAFGLASCERLMNAAEGILVLVHQKEKVILSNIEYTDFAKFHIEDRPLQAESSFSSFPANTNILYFDIEKILPIIKKHPLPGLIINMKSTFGKEREILCGRLESLMQNLSDFFPASNEEKLETYLTYNKRAKTISVTKKRYLPHQTLLETPEGAFYDLLKNHHELLTHYCNIKCSSFSSADEYIKKGPSLFFLFHPALGPIWEIIGQKIRGGECRNGSELQLEISEIFLSNLYLAGSLLIEATHVVGTNNPLVFSDHCGKCQLINVKVLNKGLNRLVPQVWWKNELRRTEVCRIILEENAEIYAENVTFRGDLAIRVPANERWIAKKGAHGNIEWIKEPITNSSWCWKYELAKDYSISIQQHTSENIFSDYSRLNK